MLFDLAAELQEASQFAALGSVPIQLSPGTKRALGSCHRQGKLHAWQPLSPFHSLVQFSLPPAAILFEDRSFLCLKLLLIWYRLSRLSFIKLSHSPK